MSIEYLGAINEILRKTYPPRYRILEVYQTLAIWYQEYNTLPSLRKAMKEAGYFVPFLELDLYDKQPIIKKFSNKVRLDGVNGYTRHTYGALDAVLYRMPSPPGEYIVTYSRECPHELQQEYIDQTTQRSATLSDWITFGDICECGNHFINISQYDECPICRLTNEPMSYSTRAEDVLGHEDTKELKFGIELEYEGVHAKQVNELLKGHAIPKSDATINRGVEVVTRPACLKTHKDSLKGFFDAVKTTAAPNTGMHIHVEKAKLSQYQIGFMLWFMNHDENYPFLEKVAGRSFISNRYVALQKDTNMTSFMYYDSGSRTLKRRESGKYVPLNTNKMHTYEFRIFRSPESHLEMSAKLDFVKALIDYASPYSFNVKSLKDKVKSENFLQFVGNRRKEYKDFVSYFKEMF